MEFGTDYADVESAVYLGASEGYTAQLRTKDGQELTGDLYLNDQCHPGKEFGVKTDEEIVGLNFEDVDSIRLGGHFGPPPVPLCSEDGKPFHNGFCWQHSGDTMKEFGYCNNPECRDPHADPNEVRPDWAGTGKYWGASIKSTTCTCGHSVSLT